MRKTSFWPKELQLESRQRRQFLPKKGHLFLVVMTQRVVDVLASSSLQLKVFARLTTSPAHVVVIFVRSSHSVGAERRNVTETESMQKTPRRSGSLLENQSTDGSTPAKLHSLTLIRLIN